MTTVAPEADSQTPAPVIAGGDTLKSESKADSGTAISNAVDGHRRPESDSEVDDRASDVVRFVRLSIFPLSHVLFLSFLFIGVCTACSYTSSFRCKLLRSASHDVSQLTVAISDF